MTFQSFDDMTHDLISDAELFINAKTEYMVSKGSLVDYCVTKEMEENRRQREWDGQIHPSALNWNSSPMTQYKKLYNKGQSQPGSRQLRAFLVGDFIHDKVEKMVGKQLFTGWAEVPLINKELKFQGTADFVGFAPGVGWCLIDFKTYSELQTDKMGGDRLAEKYQLDLDADEELKARLYTKRRVLDGPDNAHATQAFTYALFFNQFNNFLPCPPVEHVVIAYLGKDQLQIQEFYMSIKDNKHLMKRALENYQAVLSLVEAGEEPK